MPKIELTAGATTAFYGGERGVLRALVALARELGARGDPPFAAAVARDGILLGAGVNTAAAQLDPSAHAEVVAIRDAAQRTGSLDLAGATAYSSCEPCAICRTVAAAAGVGEIVFAAGKELVPTEIDSDPGRTARLVDAVTEHLPGIARQGETGLPPAELAEPFGAYVAVVGR